MSYKHIIGALDILDDSAVTGDSVVAWLAEIGIQDASSRTISGPRGSTDFLRVVIPGTDGKMAGGGAPTLGLIGRLGGLGARPDRIGFVSDGDGALTVVAAAAKLGEMAHRGDKLPGDVIITTHICPDAPTRPHEPVDFMDSPVDIDTMNAEEVESAMDAILSVDTTKGNRICNHLGFAISPTVKAGWILRVSEDLLQIYSDTAGTPPVVLPITMQDITPYGNEVYHVNSIMQPCVATDASVVGVAITAETTVPGSGTGATNMASIDSTVRFLIETAKAHGVGQAVFHDEDEFVALTSRYGSMSGLQTKGKIA
ncbi:DUF1177 domain-containing protein [Ancrocorticia sp.]|uniref:DUF1177 domain-containing protein n=1 Tax=Ancrocorticia sp. TaxID=2593684 RepID=UPI003F925CCF